MCQVGFLNIIEEWRFFDSVDLVRLGLKSQIRVINGASWGALFCGLANTMPSGRSQPRKAIR